MQTDVEIYKLQETKILIYGSNQTQIHYNKVFGYEKLLKNFHLLLTLFPSKY